MSDEYENARRKAFRVNFTRSFLRKDCDRVAMCVEIFFGVCLTASKALIDILFALKRAPHLSLHFLLPLIASFAFKLKFFVRASRIPTRLESLRHEYANMKTI